MALTAGAINGLLVGLIAEELRVGYLNYRMSQAAREYAQSDMAVDFIAEYREPLVPLICVVSFAAAGYLIHRHFARRPQALLFSWLALEAYSVCAGYFMLPANPGVLTYVWIMCIAVVFYLAYRFLTSHPDSSPSLWLAVGVSAVSVIALGVQLVGLFHYWPVVRNPLLWLLCLLGIIVINTLYGVIVQFIFNRFGGRV